MRNPSFTGPDLCAKPAREVVRLLRCGEVSPSELIEASEARVARTGPVINAMVTSCFGRARERADRLPATDAPGALHGLPIGIKDLSAVEGVRTTMGTMGLAQNVPTESDPIVDILEARGALVVGKTNTPEMGAGGNTFNAVFGATRNPWDTRRNAGGSSGGAAASLATGETWLSQGSDLAGSLRTPAAYCRVVGLRPSPGRAFGGPLTLGFSAEGISGPMARDVRDCALFLDAMCGYDGRAPLSLPAPRTPFQEGLERDPSQIRIAYAPTLGGFAPVEDEIERVMRRSLEGLAREGATVEEACPLLDGLERTYVTLRALTWKALPGRAPDAISRHYKKTLADNIAVADGLTVDDIVDANLTRTRLYHEMRRFLSQRDVLACAVVGLEPGPVEEEFPTSVAGRPTPDYIDWLRFSFLATTAGLPAISVPCGFTASGMPVGIQLIGGPRADRTVLRVALALETAMGLGAAPIDPVEPR